MVASPEKTTKARIMQVAYSYTGLSQQAGASIQEGLTASGLPLIWRKRLQQQYASPQAIETNGDACFARRMTTCRLRWLVPVFGPRSARSREIAERARETDRTQINARSTAEHTMLVTMSPSMYKSGERDAPVKANSGRLVMYIYRASRDAELLAFKDHGASLFQPGP